MKPSPALARVARGDLCSGCGGCAGLAPGRIGMVMEAAGLAAPAPERHARSRPGGRHRRDLSGSRRRTGPPRTSVLGSGDRMPDRAFLRSRSAPPGLVGGRDLGAADRICWRRAPSTALSRSPPPDTVPVANETVVSVTPGEVFAAAGSRYAPSAPLARLQEFLEVSGQAAFVGKPCDVAALRAIAKRDPRVDAKIPWMLSFFCAGVPVADGRRDGGGETRRGAGRSRLLPLPGRRLARLRHRDPARRRRRADVLQ